MSVLFCAAVECGGKVDLAKNEWGANLTLQNLGWICWNGSP